VVLSFATRQGAMHNTDKNFSKQTRGITTRKGKEKPRVVQRNVEKKGGGGESSNGEGRGRVNRPQGKREKTDGEEGGKMAFAKEHTESPSANWKGNKGKKKT